MDLTIDLSFLYQIVLFVALWLILQRFAFEPTFAVLDAREARTTGTRREAGQLRSAAERHRAHVEDSLQDTRTLLARESEEAARASAAEHARIVNEARQSAAATIEQARREAARQIETARHALEAEIGEVARRMLAQATGVEQKT